MAGTYTYTFLAKDLMSSKLSQIGNKGKSTFSNIDEKHQRLNNTLDTTNRKMERTRGGFSKILGLAGRLGIAFSLGQAVGGMISLAANTEQATAKFKGLLGSQSAAIDMVGKIRSFSSKYPIYDVKTLQESTGTMLGFGIESNKVMTILEQLGNIAGTDKQKFGRLTLAFSQMSATGRLMGEELNQMIDAGFNPLQNIAKRTGESIQQVKDRMQKGGVATREVERAFADATGKGGKFHGMMENLTKTFAGKWMIFNNKLQEFGEKMGNKVLPHLTKFLDWGIKAVEYLPIISDKLGELITWVQDSWVFQTLADNIWLIVGAYAAWNAISKIMVLGLKIKAFWVAATSKQFWKLNASMYANPIGLIIVGILAAAAAFTYAYNQIGWFRGMVDGAWETLKGFASAIKEYVMTRIQEVINGITGFGEALSHFFNGEWQKAWDVGKKAADALNPFTGKAKDNLITNAKTTGIKSIEAYMNGVDQAKKNQKDGFFGSILKNTPFQNLLSPGSPSTTNEGATGGGDGTDPFKDGVNAINGGGARQTNITVTFDKLVENFTISSQNIQQGMAQSEEELKRMLLRVLNSTNQMQTSPT